MFLAVKYAARTSVLYNSRGTSIDMDERVHDSGGMFLGCRLIFNKCTLVRVEVTGDGRLR